MTAYVVKKWEVGLKPNARGNFLEISARPPGLISWTLGLMRIDSTASLYVCSRKLLFERSSLTGRTTDAIPLNKVVGVTFGHTRPVFRALALWGFLVVSVVSFWTSADAPLYLALVVLGVASAVALAYYILNKRLRLSVVGSGGMRCTLDLRSHSPSRRNLTIQDVEQFTHLMLQLMERSQGQEKTFESSAPQREAPEPARESPHRQAALAEDHAMEIPVRR